MLLESTLSFLGLGVQEPSASWGTLIKDEADRMASCRNPHRTIPLFSPNPFRHEFSWGWITCS